MFLFIFFSVIDHCHPPPCVYGKCLNSPVGYKCVCDEGYTGNNCEEEEPGSGGSGGSGGGQMVTITPTNFFRLIT